MSVMARTTVSIDPADTLAFSSSTLSGAFGMPGRLSLEGLLTVPSRCVYRKVGSAQETAEQGRGAVDVLFHLDPGALALSTEDRVDDGSMLAIGVRDVGRDDGNGPQ